MKLKNSFWMKHKFAVLAGCFVLYFCFFDDHSVLQFLIYRHQQSELEKQIAAYKDSIARYEGFIRELDEGGESLEKYARERLLMKRENEDIYLIE